MKAEHWELGVQHCSLTYCRLVEVLLLGQQVSQLHNEVQNTHIMQNFTSTSSIATGDKKKTFY